MSGNLDGFDANTVDPTSSFDPIPKADYLLIITESGFKPTKANDGEYLQFSLEVMEGEHKGRILFDRLNLKNSNETAVKIAQSTLSAVCHATGVMKPKDSSELHNKPMMVSVGVEERKDKPGSFSNVIEGYAAVGSAAAKPAASSNEKKPPWKK